MTVVYIYIYRERERERVYIYIYIEKKKFKFFFLLDELLIMDIEEKDKLKNYGKEVSCISYGYLFIVKRN